MSSRVALFILFAVMGTPETVLAQCISNASSCLHCHETQGLLPVSSGTLPWHVDHGFGDLCVACHAGDATAVDKEAAHRGVRQPLADPSHTCTSCHAADTTALAGRYLDAMRAPPLVVAAATPGRSSAVAPTPRGGLRADRVLAGLSALLFVGLARVLRKEPRKRPRSLLTWLRRETWNPYAAGALLGVVVGCTEVFYGRPVAAAGAFDKLAAYPGRALFPNTQYYRHIMHPGITWQVWLIVGVLLGSMLSSRLSGVARLRWLPEQQWQPRFGASRWLRLALAFCGAVLVQFGAGLAGGCTSGLAISGGALLAPGAFVFMAGMFASGIPTAALWYRKKVDRCSTS